jgi:sulfite exporter TauE/SafE
MHGMTELTIAAAFLAGLAGGVHCAAMCGPLVSIVSGPRGEGMKRVPWLAHTLAYNAGRISTYVLAGALTGALGAAGLALRGEPLTQQILLAAMGLALIVIAASIAGVAPLARAIEGAGAVAWRRIQPYSRRFLPVNTPGRAFGLGLVWGWLPCGMVYVALIASLATADSLHGALVMAAFGAGTLPNLLALSVWFRNVPRLAKGRLARALIAVVIAAVGVFGIARAVQPAVVSGDAAWCLSFPGVAAAFGGGGF